MQTARNFDVQGATIEKLCRLKDLVPDEGEICFRVPFSFALKENERLKEAWSVVQAPLEFLEQIGGKIRRRIITTRSDLWVRISVPPLEMGGEEISYLISADMEFEKSQRRIYKYLRKNGRLMVFSNRGREWASAIRGYLGVDAGSISINTAFVDEDGNVLATDYTLTEGDVLNNMKKSLSRLSSYLPADVDVLGVGVTGSGHELARGLLGADVYETELDAHAEAAVHFVPNAQVVFDIGGQDSKVLYIRDGKLDDAGMNRKCGAGTGAFLDAQAMRLGIPIEEFGEVSLRAQKPHDFSCLCTVFVGRDLISEQAKGNTKENIIAGLHKSLARNFFATLGIDKKKLKTPIVFQGGVAANIGVKKALEECLLESRGEPVEILVPPYHDVMGAIGMALIARRQVTKKTRFRGFDEIDKIVSAFVECDRSQEVNCGKAKPCNIVKLFLDKKNIDTLYVCPEYLAMEERGCIDVC